MKKSKMKKVEVYVNASKPLLTESFAGYFPMGEIANPRVKGGASLNGAVILSFMTTLDETGIRSRLANHLNGGWITDIVFI
jgi:hypothetical protein